MTVQKSVRLKALCNIVVKMYTLDKSRVIFGKVIRSKLLIPVSLSLFVTLLTELGLLVHSNEISYRKGLNLGNEKDSFETLLEN